DAEGSFTLSGINPEQGVWLQVEDDRYAPDAFGLRGTDKPAEIHLKPAQVLEGRVVATDTGKAVAGVKLTVRLPDPLFNPGRFIVPDYLGVSARVLPPGSLDGVSAADGRFRLRPLSPTAAAGVENDSGSPPARRLAVPGGVQGSGVGRRSGATTDGPGVTARRGRAGPGGG